MREAVIGNDLWRVKVLKFGSIRSRVFCQADEHFCAFQIAIVIRGNVRDEVGWMVPWYGNRFEYPYDLSPFLGVKPYNDASGIRCSASVERYLLSGGSGPGK
jgi:hypothetical protein